MSQKPAKFNKFSVAESLEKVAKEKGLVKPEPQKQFKKVAEAVQKVANLAPTTNLSENIVKLCDGLRSKGFNKYADELEIKFLQYKKAQTIYDVTKEKGEDLVDRAHPEGSHQLKNVDGDSLIETIVDQHNKIKKMVEKQPTGKLAAKDAANIARIILAQATDATGLLQEAADLAKNVIDIASKGGGLTDRVLQWAQGRLGVIQGLSSKSANDLTLTDAIDVGDALDALYRNLHPNLLHNWLPEFMNKGISSDDVWEVIRVRLETAQKKVQEAQQKIKSTAITQTVGPKSPAQVGAPATPPTTMDPVAKWTALVQKVNVSTKLNDAGKRAAINYLNELRNNLNDPQKAAQTLKEIDDTEKEWTAKNFI